MALILSLHHCNVVQTSWLRFSEFLLYEWNYLKSWGHIVLMMKNIHFQNYFLFWWHHNVVCERHTGNLTGSDCITFTYHCKQQHKGVYPYFMSAFLMHLCELLREKTVLENSPKTKVMYVELLLIPFFHINLSQYTWDQIYLKKKQKHTTTTRLGEHEQNWSISVQKLISLD